MQELGVVWMLEEKLEFKITIKIVSICISLIVLGNARSLSLIKCVDIISFSTFWVVILNPFIAAEGNIQYNFVICIYTFVYISSEGIGEKVS